MVYRLATEADIPKLSELRWAYESNKAKETEISKDDFIRECNEFFLNGFEKEIWVYWIAEKDNEIISNFCIHRIRRVPKPHKMFSEMAYVTNAHTKAEYRNRGIGTALFKKVTQWARDNKIELLFLWPRNQSLSFYERQEFSMDNVIMELKL
ncbi:MAG: GNAT family N-acetyltransferase [Clostridium sp.]|nr:GNAT family N-acetyltransferase [Clostridium sp.]